MDSIDKLLGVTGNLPRYGRIKENSANLRLVCSSLYKREESDIKEFKFNYDWNSYVNSPNHKILKCFDVSFYDDSESSFYVKNSWEGAIVEAFGMALANVLLKDYYKFIISENKKNELIVMDSLGEKLRNVFHNTPEENKKDFFNKKRTISYGVALELANALYLGDRGAHNLILTPDDNLLNIDFGYLFIKSYSMPRDFLYDEDIKPSDAAVFEEGRTLGRQIITKNIKEKKDLLENLFSTAKRRGFLKRFNKEWGKNTANYLKKYDDNLMKLLESYL